MTYLTLLSKLIMHTRRTARIFLTACLIATASPLYAADWPTWRHDAHRSAASPAELPAKLYPQWIREYTPLTPAWPDQAKMQFDIVREPVVEGTTMYFNSSRFDGVRALDTRTGAEKWKYFTDGPVRFAPLAWEGRVYLTSDDGYLYCLQGSTGKVLWKFRGGPNDRKILGNERLISTWPARGAPVIADGKVYFAASIWPFMGIFIHALDARTGEPYWTNDGDGSLYMKQPHNTDSFASIAPQGPLVAVGDKLLLPGGRSVPACFDRLTGKMLRYQLAENGKRGGGSDVAAQGDVFFNGGTIFDINTEKALADYGRHIVLTPEHAFTYDAKGYVRVFDFKARTSQEAETTDAKGKKTKVKRWVMPELATIRLANVDTMIVAGDRLYCGGPEHITVLAWDRAKKTLAPSWSLAVEGSIVRLVAADDRLFAVTREGRIYCFGGEETKVAHYPRPTLKLDPVSPAMKSDVQRILSQAARSKAGYAVVWGIGDGKRIEALAQLSKMHIIVVEPDLVKVQVHRQRWTQANVYGTRIHVLSGSLADVQLPPYLASVMIFEDVAKLDEMQVAKAYQTLRPFGGAAFFPYASASLIDLLEGVARKLAQAKLVVTDKAVSLTRESALPGSANWTHEHADAANTRVSRDVLAKAPMGVLWFGGPPHDGILPRHGHGPQPQVVDGRMIIEGVDLMRAIDIYTGRLLWETKMQGVGFFYNNLAHQPGANASGTNFISMPDGIYIAYNNKCIRLDPETGKKIGEFALPKFGKLKDSPRWGYINVAGDYLIGGADPLFNPKLQPPPPKIGETGDDKEPGEKKSEEKKEQKKEKDSPITKLIKTVKGFSDNMSASRHLVVMDRHSGKVLWTASAKYSFRHNATCVGGGRLYTIDRLSGEQRAKIKLKDGEDYPPPRLVVFDLQTGAELWSTELDVFGTWLSYSEKYDVLMEAGRVARDSLLDEPKGMRAYNGKTGKVMWFNKTYTGPAMIHGDTVLQGQGACDLLTGAMKKRIDPITGESTEWKWIRNYGCNTPAASEHLLTFRSGAAGYFDLCNDGGTGNFGGFRSSCTNNLIVAGGILTAPEYTRTCTCAYQNQSSIALIHMPEAEMWTSFGTKDVKSAIQRLGLNFGAAGDRRADDGTLWLEHPNIGGISPNVQVTIKPDKVETFRRHASTVEGAYNWVASSGLKNVSEISVTLGKMDASKKYTVKLTFAEPDRNVAAGQRVFDVTMQGKKVLSNFDIVKEADGPNKSLIKTFTGIEAQGQLTLRFAPSASATVRAPIICGLELIAEEKK